MAVSLRNMLNGRKIRRRTIHRIRSFLSKKRWLRASHFFSSCLLQPKKQISRMNMNSGSMRILIVPSSIKRRRRVRNAMKALSPCVGSFHYFVINSRKQWRVRKTSCCLFSRNLIIWHRRPRKLEWYLLMQSAEPDTICTPSRIPWTSSEKWEVIWRSLAKYWQSRIIRMKPQNWRVMKQF